MMEKSSSQFDSFLFWRQPIPALDLSELEDVGLPAAPLANSAKDKASSLRGAAEDAEMSEFSSFNFWKTPIADVDSLLADLNLLL